MAILDAASMLTFVIGIVLIAVGLGLLFTPWAFVVAGIGVCVLGVAVS